MQLSLRSLLAALCVTLGIAAIAQAPTPPKPHLKGRWFLYWGYNRAQFTKSNIHFSGPDYDFILHDVVATDEPKGLTLKNYFTPKRIWLPQYNYRIGYFLKLSSANLCAVRVNL